VSKGERKGLAPAHIVDYERREEGRAPPLRLNKTFYLRYGGKEEERCRYRCVSKKNAQVTATVRETETIRPRSSRKILRLKHPFRTFNRQERDDTATLYTAEANSRRLSVTPSFSKKKEQLRLDATEPQRRRNPPTRTDRDSPLFVWLTAEKEKEKGCATSSDIRVDEKKNVLIIFGARRGRGRKGSTYDSTMA